MKYIKTYESFLDDILDKINNNGYDSLSDTEKNYLKAHSGDNKSEMDKLEKKHKIIQSTDSRFSFEYDSIKDDGNKKLYYGTINLPSLEEESYIIDGKIEGYIEVMNSGQIIPKFKKEFMNREYDIFDFCKGIEYELDSFLEYVIHTIEI